MRNWLAITLLFLTTLSIAIAQDTPLPSSKNSEGTEFWICFQRNYRDAEVNQQSQTLKKSDPLKLQLFITSGNNAKVLIEIDGIAYRKELNIRGGTVVNVSIDTAAQVRGSEEIERLAVHITADNPIAVYGLNRRFQTTDTFLALPTTVLGTEYRVMAYEKLSKDLVSQLAIVATENNTRVTITPSCVTAKKRRANAPFSITLNRGDVYQIIAGYKATSSSDLTGTKITSDKKISVFSGHNCAYVPSGTRACNHLIEQIPPLSSLGSQFYVGKLAERSRYTIRVLANEPNTRVFANAELVARLNAGEYYEDSRLEDDVQITSDNPVLVAQYAQGYQNGDSIGDPMMILVSPTQQFLSRYRFATPVNGAWRHYINVVVPREAVSTMRLDGQPIAPTAFTKFGKSRFMIARLKVPYGTHTLEGSKPFGMYSYGFGFGQDAYDAYGNMGGQSFEDVVETPDIEPPSAEIETKEGETTFTIRDDRPDDKGLLSFNVVEIEGLELSQEKIVEGMPQVDIGVTPVNAGQFGFAIVQATDVANNAAFFTICYTTNIEGEYEFILSEGNEVDCKPSITWFWGAYLKYTLNFHSAGFGTTGELTTLGTYNDTRGGGGILGGLIGARLSSAFSATARLSFDTYGGELIAPDSITIPVLDENLNVIEAQQAHTLDLSNVYMTVAVAGEYYPSENFYVYGGLLASIAVSKSVVAKRRFLLPDGLIFSESGTNEVVELDGALESVSTLRTGAFAGLGVVYPVWQNISAFGELSYTTFFSDIVDDADWGLNQAGLQIGARVRF